MPASINIQDKSPRKITGKILFIALAFKFLKKPDPNIRGIIDANNSKPKDHLRINTIS